MALIRPMLCAALMLAPMLAPAQSSTNNPPNPGNNTPPVSCGTGAEPMCGLSSRGYLLRNCPIITTEVPPDSVDSLSVAVEPQMVATNEPSDPVAGFRPPFTKVLCSMPVAAPLPYLECQKFSGYVICEGFPSGADELLFQWTTVSANKTTIIINQDLAGRFIRIECPVPWSGRIELKVTNTLTGDWATDFANIACQPSVPVPVSDEH